VASPVPGKVARDTRGARSPGNLGAGPAGSAAESTAVPAAGTAHWNVPGSADAAPAGGVARHGTARVDVKARDGTNSAVHERAPPPETRLPARQPMLPGAISPPWVCPSSFPRPYSFKVPRNAPGLNRDPGQFSSCSNRHPMDPWCWSRRSIPADPAVARCCPASANRLPPPPHAKAPSAAPSC
jgi:hypothetical protein